MGFFGTYQFDGAAWADGDPETGPMGSEPWLWVDIYDSDFAAVRYAPAVVGTGIAYLNVTPRVYFESDGASVPTDVDRESHGLAEWWGRRHPGATAIELDAKRAEIAKLLASDDEPSVDESDDEADIFAEIKAARLLVAMDVPLPKDLRF